MGKLRRRLIREESHPDVTLEVVPEEHLIRNVCVLGPTSKNRNRYLPKALQEALPLYQGARSFINHPDDPKGKRKFEARLGTIINPRIQDGKIYADYSYNPKHPYAGVLEHAAEHDPDFCGLSHNVETEGRELEDGTWEVHKIADVRSVDLVAEPATNRNLQESAMDPELDGMGEDEGDPEKHLGKLIGAFCNDSSMTKAEKRKKIIKALDLYDDPEEGEEGGVTNRDGGMGEEEEEMEDEEGGGNSKGEEFKDEEEGGGADMDLERPENKDEWQEKDEEEDEEECPDCGGKMVDGECPKCDMAAEKKEKAVMKESVGYLRTLAASKNPKVSRSAKSLLEQITKKKPVREEVQVRRKSVLHPRLRQLQEENQRIRLELDELQADRALSQKSDLAIRLCKRARLPREVITETFLGQLMDAPSRQVMESIIEDRRQLAGIRMPVYTGVTHGDDGLKGKKFAAAVKNGIANVS